MDDMFGHVPQAGELEMAAQPQPVTRHTGPNTPEHSRERLHRIIARLRAADTLPLTPYQLRSLRGRSPWIAEWLPDGEGDRLMAELRAELVRLGADPSRPAPGEPVPDRTCEQDDIDVFD